MLVNLPKQSAASKKGGPKYRIYLANFNDVDVENFPKPIDASITSSILKQGKKFNYLDCQNASIKPNAQPGESPYNGKLILTPIVEGISKRSLSWVYDNVGEDVVCIWERCADGQKFLGGSPCSGGMKLKYTAIGTQDGGIDGIALSLEGGECPEPFYFYDAEIEVEADEPAPPVQG